MTSLTEHHITADLADQAGGPKVAFGSWTDAVRRSVLSFQFDCDRPRAFGGMLSHRSLAGVSFINMTSDRHAAYRDRSMISEADTGFYVMTLQLAGQLRLAQDDRVAVLKPGLFAIYDSSKPAALTSSDGYESTCIRFPKQQLGARRADPLAEVTATAFDCAPGLPSAVWDMLISLNRNLESLGTHGRYAVRNAMDMVATMLRTELSQADVATSGNETLLENVRDYIDAHLCDPELGPTQIAAAHYVSPRHLHHLFERTNFTVARWIRTRRIELCQRNLADPALIDVPVSTIGIRWGFNGSSHFGQVFKHETGQTPGEYREEAMTRAGRSGKPSTLVRLV